MIDIHEDWSEWILIFVMQNESDGFKVQLDSEDIITIKRKHLIAAPDAPREEEEEADEEEDDEDADEDNQVRIGLWKSIQTCHPLNIYHIDYRIKSRRGTITF